MTGGEPPDQKMLPGGATSGRHQADHRRPPRPPGYSLPDQPGRCHLCLLPVTREDGSIRLRARWHTRCALLWGVMNRPSDARLFVYKRDRGVCADCGVQDDRLEGEWDVDHHLRLADANGDPAYWQPPNLKTRCRAVCHKAKTAAENRVSNEGTCHDRPAP